MKKNNILLSLILIFLLQTAAAQDILLIDPKLKEPVQRTDSISFGLLRSGGFPLHKDDISKTISGIENLLKELEHPDTKTLISGHRPLGKSELILVASGKEHSPILNLYLTTHSGENSASIELLSREKSRRSATKKLYQILDYLRNNASIL